MNIAGHGVSFFLIWKTVRDYLDYFNEAIVCRKTHQENVQLKIIVKKDGCWQSMVEGCNYISPVFSGHAHTKMTTLY